MFKGNPENPSKSPTSSHHWTGWSSRCRFTGFQGKIQEFWGELPFLKLQQSLVFPCKLQGSKDPQGCEIRISNLLFAGSAAFAPGFKTCRVPRFQGVPKFQGIQDIPRSHRKIPILCKVRGRFQCLKRLPCGQSMTARFQGPRFQGSNVASLEDSK